jgi:hypothetical protein
LYLSRCAHAINQGRFQIIHRFSGKKTNVKCTRPRTGKDVENDARDQVVDRGVGESGVEVR